MGARRFKGKRVRGTSGMAAVFGVFKRTGCVYTEIVADCRTPRCKGISAVVSAWTTVGCLRCGFRWYLRDLQGLVRHV
jgi:hypothetical protein